MKIRLLALGSVWLSCGAVALAQQPSVRSENGSTDAKELSSIHERLDAYVDAFNERNGKTLSSFWITDGVSVAEETGNRVEGREAIRRSIESLWEANPNAKLSVVVKNIRKVRPDVVTVEGETTLFVPGADPIGSAFTCIMVKEENRWLISSSHERDLPTPLTPRDALIELEWLVGKWEDQSDGAEVKTTFHWSPNQAFLIRSFAARLEDDAPLQGTQVIGWDPLSKEIRTWTFNSDGSFGEGTVTKQNEAWMLSMWQVLADGRMASATRMMTPVDKNTMTVQTVNETIDGLPLPASAPVKVVRVADGTTEAGSQSATERRDP